MTEKKKEKDVPAYFNSVTPFTTPAPMAPSTLRPQNPENAPPKIPLRPPAGIASPVEEKKDEHGFVTFLDNITPDDMGGLFRGDSNQWIGRPIWYKETVGKVFGASLSLGEATMNSLLWASDQGLDAYKWGQSALPGGMRTLDMEWEYASIPNNKGGIVGEVDKLSAGMVGQIDAATRMTRPNDDGFGMNFANLIGDRLAATSNPMGAGQALNTQIYTALGDPLDVTNEDVASVVTANGIDEDLRDKIFTIGTPQGASSFVGDAVSTVVMDPTLWASGGLSALRYGIKGTKWAGLTNQSLRSADNAISFGQQIDRGFAGTRTGPYTDVVFLAKNHNKPEVLLEHPFVKGPDAQDTVRWLGRAAGDEYKTAAVIKAKAGLRDGWESLRQADPGLFDDMASAQGMRTLPNTGAELTTEQRVLGENLVEKTQTAAKTKSVEHGFSKHALIDDNNIERPSFSFGNDDEIVFIGADESFDSALSPFITKVPTTPEGLVEEAIKRNPNDQKLQSMFTNIKNKDFGDDEVELLDSIIASVSIDDTLKVSQIEQTSGFAQVLSALAGNKKAAQLVSSKVKVFRENVKNARMENSSLARESNMRPGNTQEPAAYSDLASVHSTSRPVIRDADGNISLNPSAYYRSDAARSSIHFTLNSEVKSHMGGTWDDTNKLIVTNAEDVVKANGAPSNLNPIDSWWSVSPGKKLNLPKPSVVSPYIDEASYLKELRSRGLIKPGQKTPAVVADSQTNDVFYFSKAADKYTDADRIEILEAMGKPSYKQAADMLIGKESETLRQYALDLAMRQQRVSSGPESLGQWGYNWNDELADRISALNSRDGIRGSIHQGSPAETIELTRGSQWNRFNGGEIDTYRWLAANGSIKTESRTMRSSITDDGFDLTSAGVVDDTAKAAKEASDRAVIDSAAAGQTLERGGSRFAGASRVANAWREGRAQAKWNTPTHETINYSDGWVVDIFRATSSSRPIQVVRWVGAARPAGIVHLKGADNANSHVEVSSWLKHSDLSAEQRAVAFAEYMQAATPSARKAALESMEWKQVEIVAKKANLTPEKARILYNSYAEKRALFARQFSGQKGFAVAEDQSLVTAPGLYSELDESFAMLNTRVFDRVVSKHAGFLEKVEDATEILDAVNSYWKLSVLMRIGYPLRNVTEGLLRSIAVAGVVMTNPEAITNIPSAIVLKAAGKRVSKRIAVQGEALRVAQNNLQLARQSIVKARIDMRLDELKLLDDALDSARVEVTAAKEALATEQFAAQAIASMSPWPSTVPNAQVIPMPSSVKAYKLPEHKVMKAAEQQFDDALETAALLDFRASGGAAEFVRESAGVYRNGSYRIARDGKKWNLFDGDTGDLIQTYPSLREAQTGSSVVSKSPKAIKALEKKLGAARREALVKANALQRARDARIRATEKANAAVTREWKAAQVAADKKYLAELRAGKSADKDAIKKAEALLKDRTKRVEQAQKRVDQAELKSAKAYDRFDEVNQKVIAGTPRLSELTAAERRLIADIEIQSDTLMNSSASLARVIDAQRAGRIGSKGNKMGENGPVLDSAFQGPDGELAMLLSSADETVAATYMYGYEAKRKALLMSRDYDVINPASLDADGMKHYWSEMVDRWNRSYRSDTMVRLWLGQTDNATSRSAAKKWLSSADGNEYRASMNGVSRGARGTGKGRWELNDAKGHPIQDNVDEYVDLMYAEFSRVVPMEVRSTLLRRPMLPEEAAAAFGSNPLPSIAGRAELPKIPAKKTGTYLRDKVDRGSSFVMKWLGSIPETRLLRHPFYSRQYDVAQKQMYQLAYDQGIDVMSKAVQQRIATAAHKRALRATRDTMYTIENISNSASMLRWASPFFPAFENTIRTWSRIVYRNPAVLAWGQKLWNMPNSFGMIVDENGNKVRSSNMFKDDNHFFIMPEMMAAGIAKIPFQSLVPVDEDGKPISNMVRRAGYNVVIQGGEWWHPGTGGMVAMPLAFALRGRPEVVDILKANMSKEVYFATFPSDPNAPLWQNMLSTGMKRVNQIVGDDPDSAWAKTRLTMQRDAYIAAQIENRPFTKKDAEKADRRAQAFWNHAIGQAYTGFTASTTYLSPYAAQERIWAELRDDTTLAFEEKVSAFHAKVGSDDFDAITRSTSESSFGVDSNLAAYNRLKDHKGFVESLARRHGEETVGMFTNLGNTRERFSPAVYGEYFDEEINGTSIKDRMGPEQYSEVQQQRDGTDFYYGEMAKLDQAAVDMGYADASSINTDAMDQVKKKLYALTKQQYPMWDQATYEDELPNRIRAAREIIDEIGPELGKTGEFVKAYLASRDRVAEALSSDRPEGYTVAEWEVAKDNVRDAMNESTLRMRQMDIGFSDWWDRWMQKDTFKVVL